MDTRMILKWVVNNLESNRPSHSLYLNSRTRSPARSRPASTTRSSTASSTRRNRRGMKPGSPPLLSVWMKACNDAPAFKRKKALTSQLYWSNVYMQGVVSLSPPKTLNVIYTRLRSPSAGQLGWLLLPRIPTTSPIPVQHPPPSHSDFPNPASLLWRGLLACHPQ